MTKNPISCQQHRDQSQSLVAHCAIVTLSDTRTPETDTSGKHIADLLKTAGHVVADYQIIPDDPKLLKSLLETFFARQDIGAILTNGGTGISPRDLTIPVVESLIAVPLPGFGELFRMLSWQEIGSGAMLSRATAGVAKSGHLLFALPGSTPAVELAMKSLILPELRHLLWVQGKRN